MCCRQDPKVLVTELPIMQCIPIEASKLKLQNTFRTPVYVTQVCPRLDVEYALLIKRPTYIFTRCNVND